MDTTILRKAGLTESQAKGYLALIEHGSLSPADLADKIDESRTNGYAIADKLVSLGLATKKDDKKAVYSPNHPSAIEDLAEKRRKVLARNELYVKQGLSPLIDFFYTHSELPGTRTLEGVEGIRSVYDDTIKTKQDIYLLRTTADSVDLGLEYLDNYRAKRASAGVHTFALTPDTDIGRLHYETGEDKKMLFHRTVLPKGSYTAPVEVDIYGSKVALITYGETQIATVVDSPPVAEAMRQIFKLLAEVLGSGGTGVVPIARRNP